MFDCNCDYQSRGSFQCKQCENESDYSGTHADWIDSMEMYIRYITCQVPNRWVDLYLCTVQYLYIPICYGQGCAPGEGSLNGLKGKDI